MIRANFINEARDGGTAIPDPATASDFNGDRLALQREKDRIRKQAFRDRVARGEFIPTKRTRMKRDRNYFEAPARGVRKVCDCGRPVATMSKVSPNTGICRFCADAEDNLARRTYAERTGRYSQPSIGLDTYRVHTVYPAYESKHVSRLLSEALAELDGLMRR